MYEVTLEIQGPAAMFTRPDTGSTPVSYPAPPFSAAKGIFEAIARKRGAVIRPTRVEICRPLRYERYITNYGGPLRKPSQVKGGNNYQLIATILVDVCYRLWGVALPDDGALGGVNAAHALQEIFTRRLVHGQWFYAPCLGWKEFVPSYVGPFREGTQRESSLNLTIPSMLHSVFDRLTSGSVSPSFVQNVAIDAGVLEYGGQDQC